MKRDFKAILFHIAKYLKVKYDLKGELNDSFVSRHNAFIAKKLDIKPASLSVLKVRNSIPYDVILGFCFKEEIDALKVFYSSK